MVINMKTFMLQDTDLDFSPRILLQMYVTLNRPFLYVKIKLGRSDTFQHVFYKSWVSR